MRTALSALLALLLSFGAAAQQGGIDLFTGETLFQAGWRANVTEVYRHQSLSGGGGSADDLRSILAVDYAITSRTGVGLLVPHVHREFRFDGGPNLRSSGLGDASIFGKFRLWHDPWKGGGSGGAILAGIELPTGETDEEESGVRLAPQFQPGFGAANPWVSFATTYETERRIRFDLAGLYKLNVEGSQGLDRGDFFSLSLTGAYRIWHEKYPGPTLGFSTGLLWRHSGRGELSGVRLSDDGSDILSARFASVFHPRPNWDIALRVDATLAADSNGSQFEEDVRLALTVGIRF